MLLGVGMLVPSFNNACLSFETSLHASMCCAPIYSPLKTTFRDWLGLRFGALFGQDDLVTVSEILCEFLSVMLGADSGVTYLIGSR